MHYKCKKCNYEFDVTIVEHPHTMAFLTVGVYGCPICRKAEAQSKVCPKCQSTDLEQSLSNYKEEEK